MTNTININLKFNASQKGTEAFIGSFKDDLKYCLKRFGIALVIGENIKSNEFSGLNFTLISAGDLTDSSFVNSINNESIQHNKNYLLTLEPIRANNSSLAFLKIHSFNFWDKIVETGETRFFRENDSTTRHLYWERITDIAFEIIDRTSNNTKVGSIFLAQTHESQNQDRDNLKRDLEDLGYIVLPEKPISNDFDESVTQINEYLSSSQLIIHLIPLSYSEYFSGKSLSLVEHQCNLSANYINSSKRNINRIIWMPSEFDVIDEKNQIFVERIQRDQDLSNKTLILKVNLEDLKKIYRKLLLSENSVNVDMSNLPDLYVIADKHDESIAKMIDAEARSAGVSFGINYSGISYNQHLKYLASAQFIVVNYTLENQQWINVKVHDILKSPGLETSKPNKKLVLIKSSKELDTSHFEKYFNEVRVVEANEIKLNFLK